MIPQLFQARTKNRDGSYGLTSAVPIETLIEAARELANFDIIYAVSVGESGIIDQRPVGTLGFVFKPLEGSDNGRLDSNQENQNGIEERQASTERRVHGIAVEDRITSSTGTSGAESRRLGQEDRDGARGAVGDVKTIDQADWRAIAVTDQSVLHPNIGRQSEDGFESTPTLEVEAEMHAALHSTALLPPSTENIAKLKAEIQKEGARNLAVSLRDLQIDNAPVTASSVRSAEQDERREKIGREKGFLWFGGRRKK